jgi:hypothetical protein
MNEKKSVFGDLCHQFRGRLHLSEQTMGQKIEERGYKLGVKPGSNKQPVISQFEREIAPLNASHKKHRDPPLEYVEACAKLFELKSSEKYSLFVAALNSSERIVIDKNAIEGNAKDRIINIIGSLLLSCTKLDEIIEKDKKEILFRQSASYQDKDLVDAWNTLEKASQNFSEKIKQHPLEYNNLFKKDHKSLPSPLNGRRQ